MGLRRRFSTDMMGLLGRWIAARLYWRVAPTGFESPPYRRYFKI